MRLNLRTISAYAVPFTTYRYLSST